MAVNLVGNSELDATEGFFHMPQICVMCDRRHYFRSELRRAKDLFAMKNKTASAGFEPANSGTKDQHDLLSFC
jgi:hypothetical protein